MQEQDIISENEPPAGEEEHSTIGRRDYLKTVGIAIGSISAVTTTSDAVQARSSGYGGGGYGAGAYGGGTSGNSLVVSTTDATSTGSTSAVLNGSLDNIDGKSSVDCYFRWRQVGTSSWNTTAKRSLSSTGSFSAELSGLEDGIDYVYKTIAQDGNGNAGQGSTVTFTTTDTPPAVSTGPPTNVTDSTVSLNGSLDDTGDAPSVDCQFEWREVGASSWNATTMQILTSTGSFSVDITNLSGSTDYEYRATARALDGDTETGATVSVSTNSSGSMLNRLVPGN
ncbi:MAG: fibronectin type III domain-containing protein [Halobellus sp.]|uniref:fibronectin type III domain-containing protein n=1 Tax=Halobellus sp. TaxID=1979212 RepID=UPI0035D4AB5E